MKYSWLKFSAFLLYYFLGIVLFAFIAHTVWFALLPTEKIVLGNQVVDVVVARTPFQHSMGLMFRPTLGRQDGMLFVFPGSDPQCMWMANTFIPLSVAFIDANGEILKLDDMSPLTKDSHCSGVPIKFALETSQGWFDTHRIQVGTSFRRQSD